MVLVPHDFLLKRTTRPNAAERWKTTVEYVYRIKYSVIYTGGNVRPIQIWPSIALMCLIMRRRPNGNNPKLSTFYEATKQGDIEIKKRMGGLATGWGAGAGDRGEPLGLMLELMIPPTRRPGSLVVDRPACTGELQGYIPGLTLPFVFLRRLPFRSVPYGDDIV